MRKPNDSSARARHMFSGSSSKTSSRRERVKGIILPCSSASPSGLGSRSQRLLLPSWILLRPMSTSCLPETFGQQEAEVATDAFKVSTMKVSVHATLSTMQRTTTCKSCPRMFASMCCRTSSPRRRARATTRPWSSATAKRQGKPCTRSLRINLCIPRYINPCIDLCINPCINLCIKSPKATKGMGPEKEPHGISQFRLLWLQGD
mmetsp:Transcript_63946/g.101756  ORF Transcript_63946/g.101756 Transcript_63946/m.101756 type:complete len:205 (-) Transcript_63946:431-1045(-)